MLSRVADDLYWFGRYLRRAESVARLVNVHSHLLMDLPRTVEEGWAPLIPVTGNMADFQQRYTGPDEISALRFLVVDEDSPASVRWSLQRARELLRTLRDCMPREVWERYNDLHYHVQENTALCLSRSGRVAYLQRVIDGVLLIRGLIETTMSRDAGYRCFQIGVLLEQADMTTRVIDVRSRPLLGAGAVDALSPFRNIQWVAVLQSLGAHQMFRRHVRSRVSAVQVLAFLLQNRDFPRSVRFCLQAIRTELMHLPPRRAPSRSIDRLVGIVLDVNPEHAVRHDLNRLMDELQGGLAELNDELTAAFFRG